MRYLGGVPIIRGYGDGGGVIRRVIRVIEPITLQNPKNPPEGYFTK